MLLLGRWFWVASVILMALGTVLTSTLRESGALPLVLLAPLTAVLSLTHAVRTPFASIAICLISVLAVHVYVMRTQVWW